MCYALSMRELLILAGLGALALVGGLALSKNSPDTASTPASVISEAAVKPPAISDSDFTVGSKDAPVSLIEYLDFQCPACAVTFPLTESVVSKYDKNVRYAVRIFPLSQHKNSIPATKAAFAAGKQGKFFPMADKLFATQKDWENLPDPASTFEGYARDLGLNMDEYKTDRDSSETAAKIAASSAEATNLKLGQTPTYFVDGKLFSPESEADFEGVLKPKE